MSTQQNNSDHVAVPPAEGAVASPVNGAVPDREALFEYIKHGDEAHQAWLRQAIDAFFYGLPKPAAQKAEPVAIDLDCSTPTSEQPREILIQRLEACQEILADERAQRQDSDQSGINPDSPQAK